MMHSQNSTRNKQHQQQQPTMELQNTTSVPCSTSTVPMRSMAFSCSTVLTLRHAMLLLQKKRDGPSEGPSVRGSKRQRVHKQVRFAQDVAKLSKPYPAANADTWYNDTDYATFMRASRQTVQVVQQALHRTGTLETLDLENHTLLGLEHFVSPCIEQAREQLVRHHCQHILSLQRRAVLN